MLSCLMRSLPLSILLLMLALSAACREGTTPTGPGASPPDSPPAVSVARLPSLSASEALAPDDPAAEGWDIEEFNRRATKQLKQLGAMITAPRLERDRLSELAAERFEATPLLPAQTREVFRDHIFEIRRPLGDLNRSSSDRVRIPLAQAIEPLWKQFHNLRDLHFKFKLFRVLRSDDQFATRQYFQLAGTTDNKTLEQNSTWTVGWHSGDEHQPPRIAWIQLDEFEQVVANVPGGRVFVDCTGSLLKAEQAYQTTLLQGIAHWRDRLEKQSAVYNFGHHGLALGDVNGDGWDDLYVCQTGGLPNLLLLRNSDGTLTDQASEAGVDYLDNTRSALFLDLDNDGDQDLVVSLTSGLLLLQNIDDGRFLLRARMPGVRQGFSLAGADYDQDGWVDIFACVYYGSGSAVSELPLPLPYFDATNGGANHLIRNHGNWEFSDVTKQAGLDEDNRRFSFAAAWEDDDNDGDLDLLVVNDFGPNHLFRNDGGRFRQVANEVGIRDGAFGMSATWGDYDHDGRYDLYVSNMFSAAGNRVTFDARFKSRATEQTRAKYQYLARGNSLFHNLGPNRYEDVSLQKHVTMGRWSWASLFADLNNDSWDDLLVTNGFLTGRDADDL